MGCIQVASAFTEIRLTGSTAFRSATINSIQAILNPDYVWGGNPSATGGANQQVFVGTTKVGGIQVVIKTAWAGSAGGVFAVATPAPAVQPFIIDPTGVSFSPAAGTVGGIALTHAGVAIPNSDTTESHLADVALSDAFAASTPFHGVTLKDTIVGVVPFEWVKGAYTPDGTVASAVAGGYPGVTNINTDQAQELIGGGLALNQLTGVAADNAIVAQMVGRDHDSGTRIGYIYDSQVLGCIFGAPTDGFTDPILQYLPQGNGVTGTNATVGATQFDPQSAGTGVISGLVPWPVESVVGESRPLGSEGFFSGGNVKNTLNRPVDTSAGNYIISALGMGDANGVNPDPTGVTYVDGAGVTNTIHPSLNALTFNGNFPGTAAHPFAPPYVNIEQGKYNFWGYEHYLYATSLAGSVKTVADQISGQLTTEADFGGVGELLSHMNASRATDGAPITSP
ncbi:MAG TPA: hypothetical protein VFB27_10805 [Opitutaceae bacterium]|nr:hypothetical protein [Opitutaceae bacterium]